MRQRLTITQRKTRTKVIQLLVVIALLPAAWTLQAQRDQEPVVFSRAVQVGGAALQIDFAGTPLDLPHDVIIERIQMAARAVTTYYGKFPVPRARILVVGVAGRHGVLQGTTWGSRFGFPAFLRIRIGQSTSQQELQKDWMITHEMVHTALTSLPDDQHWLEEGLASYIEPIARVQAGEMPAESIWADMVHGMPNGEPRPDDQGLDRTHTWGRTYWGGALFCLAADIEIRRQTHNRKGLQDALRAVVAAGATINTERPLASVLKIADEATGTQVLSEMYAKWSVTPVDVNLDNLWKQLGVAPVDPTAPLAAIRQAVTKRMGDQ